MVSEVIFGHFSKIMRMNFAAILHVRMQCVPVGKSL